MPRWPDKTREERFFDKVHESKRSYDGTPCWEWTGAESGGYGEFYAGKERGKMKAYKWSYIHLISDVPPGLELDHLCRNKICVNPYHLDPVPHVVNMARGTVWDWNRSKTHCPSGHPYSIENVRMHGTNRQCKTCQRIRALERYRKNRDQINAARYARRKAAKGES